jgi:hypothetical protein
LIKYAVVSNLTHCQNQHRLLSIPFYSIVNGTTGIGTLLIGIVGAFIGGLLIGGSDSIFVAGVNVGVVVGMIVCIVE